MRRVILLVLALLLIIPVQATPHQIQETEPNDTPAQANPLSVQTPMDGAIEPIGDHDYYALEGINPNWGFIALLDTSASSSSQAATLSAFGADGTTVLQSSIAGWNNGVGIALQSFVDDSATHYLRVEETGADAAISAYNLRLFETITFPQPELESNETRSTGTPSGYTHAGVLDTLSDVDCYGFHGRADDTIILALKADPEGDGSPGDYRVSLIGPDDALLQAADANGVAGDEFLEQTSLPSDGLYAYCVALSNNGPGLTTTYHIGIIRNGGLYKPEYSYEPSLSHTGAAQIGDTLSFQLAVTNTSPLLIPDNINLQVDFNPDCLAYAGADIAPTAENPDRIQWYGIKNGLAAGDSYMINVQFTALDVCTDQLHMGLLLPYYFSGSIKYADYVITAPLYIPLIRR